MKNPLGSIMNIFGLRKANKNQAEGADLKSGASRGGSDKMKKSKPLNLHFSSRARRAMGWTRYHISGLH